MNSEAEHGRRWRTAKANAAEDVNRYAIGLLRSDARTSMYLSKYYVSRDSILRSIQCDET